MTESNKPINFSAKNEKAPIDDLSDIKGKISDLVNGQLFGVLCTQADGQPYGSMIGFAFSDDLKYAVFSTPRATRKYKNLTQCPNVSLVVNNREKNPYELMKIQAFTAIGSAEEIIDKKEHSRWSKLLLSRQSCLKKFLESPTTALFRIQISRYFFVSYFQDVREWAP